MLEIFFPFQKNHYEEKEGEDVRATQFRLLKKNAIKGRGTDRTEKKRKLKHNNEPREKL